MCSGRSPHCSRSSIHRESSARWDSRLQKEGACPASWCSLPDERLYGLLSLTLGSAPVALPAFLCASYLLCVGELIYTGEQENCATYDIFAGPEHSAAVFVPMHLL